MHTAYLDLYDVGMVEAEQGFSFTDKALQDFWGIIFQGLHSHHHFHLSFLEVIHLPQEDHTKVAIP